MASYIIKGHLPHVRTNLQRVPMSEVGISAVTEAELRFGVLRKPQAVRLQAAVEEFILRVEIMTWDSTAARHYAMLCSALEDSGTLVGNLDMMIAAQALAAAAVLVSHDKVFQRVKHLKIDDWTKVV